MANINPIGPNQNSFIPSSTNKKLQNNKEIPSFKDTMNKFLKDVNNLQNKANTSVEKMMAGEVNDVHQVISDVGKAKLALTLLLEIRNKALDAYSEVMRMRL